MKSDKTIVYTYGAFDLLHLGHLKLLERAKALGDYLIVGIVDNKPIRELKGNDRPIILMKDRLELVKALRCVDRVIYQPEYDPTSVLECIFGNAYNEFNKVDILAKGDDWDEIPGKETIERLGGKLVKLPYSLGYSTSDIVKRIRGEKND